MSIQATDYTVLIYWALYFVLGFLPHVVYRDFRKYDRLEMIESFPERRRLIILLPRIQAAGTLLAVLVIFGIWFDSGLQASLPVHIVGVAYGALLLLDASMAWYTGLRSLGGFREARYAVDQARTWRMQLQFGLALTYAGTALVFLLQGIARS